MVGMAKARVEESNEEAVIKAELPESVPYFPREAF